MVEVVDHLRLVEREKSSVAPTKEVAVQDPAVGLQLLPRSEQAGVVGHVEHRHEADTPWVLFGVPSRIKTGTRQ